MKRVGIFAGTFDPIHDGHIEVAKSAVEHLELDELYFLVEKKPWSAKNPIDIKHRQKMVELAILKIAKFLQLDLGEERFTIVESLPKIEKWFAQAELYFIFGGDIFMKMDVHKLL